jgi:DNA-directed RNA polymerase subunit RPC12/RpoP
MGVVIYRAKCLDCKHEWTSKTGSGTPNACPKSACRSKRITISPIG